MTTIYRIRRDDGRTLARDFFFASPMHAYGSVAADVLRAMREAENEDGADDDYRRDYREAADRFEAEWKDEGSANALAREGERQHRNPCFYLSDVQEIFLEDNPVDLSKRAVAARPNGIPKNGQVPFRFAARPAAKQPNPVYPASLVNHLRCPECGGELFSFQGEAICRECVEYTPVLYGDESVGSVA